MATPIFDKKKKRNIGKTIKLYVVPIITIVVFIFILIGLTLPKVVGMLDLNAQIDSVNLELEQRRSELAKLKALYENIDEVSNYLAVVRDIAPIGKTEVVSFRDKITNIIFNNNLTISRQTLSESDIQPEGVENDFFLREVPFIFEVAGDYTNIVNFLNDLNTIDDFIVVKQMDLAQNTEGQWGLDINIVKYQFTEELNDENMQKLFQNVSVDSKISEEIKEFLERRL